MCWPEWHRSLFAATGADRTGLHLLRRRTSASSGSRNPLCLASLAPFGFVLELLVVKEQLLSCGENEITAAVNALQDFVLEFHCRPPRDPLALSLGGSIHRRGKIQPGCVHIHPPLFGPPAAPVIDSALGQSNHDSGTLRLTGSSFFAGTCVTQTHKFMNCANSMEEDEGFQDIFAGFPLKKPP